MMSLILSLFLVYHAPSRWKIPTAALALIYEVYTVFEITYLGTHTVMDVLVGFTYGVCYFILYLLWRTEPVQRVFRKLSFASLTFLLLVLSAVTLALEVLESHYDQMTVHPEEWQRNYESYCRLQSGTGAHHMRNSSAYEKTAIMLGLVASVVLVRLLRARNLQLSGPLLLRAVAAVAGFAVFTYSKAILNTAAVALVGHKLTGNWRFLVHFVQPIFLLVVFPAVLRLFGLARSRGGKDKTQ